MTARSSSSAPSSTPAAWCASTPSAPTCRRTARCVALAERTRAPAPGAWPHGASGCRRPGPRSSASSSVAGNGPVAVGSDVRVDVRVNLGGLSPDDVRVEVVAGVPNGDGLSPRSVVEGVHEGGRAAGSATSPWCPPPRAAGWRAPRGSCRCAPTVPAPSRTSSSPGPRTRAPAARAARGLKSVHHPADDVWTCPTIPSAGHPRGSSSTVPSPSAGPARRWPAGTATPVSRSRCGCAPRWARSRIASTTTAGPWEGTSRPSITTSWRASMPRRSTWRRRGHPRGPRGPAGGPARPGAPARPLI